VDVKAPQTMLLHERSSGTNISDASTLIVDPISDEHSDLKQPSEPLSAVAFELEDRLLAEQASGCRACTLWRILFFCLALSLALMQPLRETHYDFFPLTL